ncbi:protein SIEVE ELEMENT OCCLUSION B-like [Diospyros lotus]|uniref:protein SIEVE ELEMENT OCCLUSION B-like n=1 Tax=Diospyros lotus TaxID=55363 RepID=UPI002254B75D|nr:protein SIEVE ELEMENT OCCLUSION B-like [Diospyros lotus]
MANFIAAAPPKYQQLRGGGMFSSSDDSAMLNQIQTIHAPDGREIDVKPLLHVIENIMNHSGPTAKVSQGQLVDAIEEKVFHDGLGEMLELVSHTINKISCEMSCKCLGGSDAHATTLAIFHLLASYTWEAKVVIALAAFAVNYGEFWLVAQLYLTNPLAKSVGLLKQLPEILERGDSLKPKFEAFTTLIQAMLDVTACIVEFNELPAQYIAPDTPALLTAKGHIPVAVYWTIRSIVACASQMMNLVGMGHEYIASTTEAWELSSLAHKLSNIHSHLQKQLALCYQHVDENRHIEAYQTLVRLFETPHIDNTKILRALIYAREDQLPLIDGSTKRRVSIDVLRRKIVLLFISDLDLAQDEIFILQQMYTDARQNPTRDESQYEVVWLPVVDRSTPWDSEKQTRFETLQAMMPWYSVFHPSQLDPAVVKYIKEAWHFNKKLLLVVLDPQGRVVNHNAIHMLLIWGSLAFPFTSLREEGLWKEETWRMDLLADSVHPSLFNWITEGKYICLYGGEDLEWIRRFTVSLKAVAKSANIPLEILYVGKSNRREKIQRINSIISAEQLSHIMPDVTLNWFFWVRLESMWHSKMQHSKSPDTDTIVQEIVKMLSFDGGDQGWAVISRSSEEMAKANADVMLKSLARFDQWRGRAAEVGFVPALNENLQDLRSPHHCNRLILPSTAGKIPERVVCAECGRPMEKFFMYRCCTD